MHAAGEGTRSRWPGAPGAGARMGPWGGARSAPHAEQSVAEALPQGPGRWEGSAQPQAPAGNGHPGWMSGHGAAADQGVPSSGKGGGGGHWVAVPPAGWGGWGGPWRVVGGLPKGGAPCRWPTLAEQRTMAPLAAAPPPPLSEVRIMPPPPGALPKSSQCRCSCSSLVFALVCFCMQRRKEMLRTHR